MSCKYPENSRSYMFCIGCKEADSCSSSTFNIPMPDNVKSPKNSIPTAAEAKNVTKLAIENSITKQLEELSFEINTATHKGKYAIANDGTLDSEVKRRLEALGYNVTIGNQYNKSYYTIRWE